MPQMSQIASAFLDGFGSLGAIFEPVVRPGSQDNLIQQSVDLSSDSLALKEGFGQAASSGGVVFRVLVLNLWFVSFTIRRAAKEMTEVRDKAHHGA